MLKFQFETGPLELEKLPISDEELVERYEKVFVAVCSDILYGYDLNFQVLPDYLKPLVPGSRMAGIAYTIKGIKCDVKEERREYYDRTVAMFEGFEKTSFAIWETGMDVEEPIAHYGEMMATASKGCGCRGAIVDGGVRDIDRINELGFKMWSRTRTPLGAEQRSRIVAWQCDIRIGNTIIHPGDVIFADTDGIVVIPRKIAFEVLEEAERRQSEEDKWKGMLLDGMAPRAFLEAGGSF